MTQAAATAPTTRDQIIDHTLRQIEAAWVTEQFDAIIEANWPTEPPAPPPAAGPTPPEPPRPGSPAPLQPRGAAHRSAGPAESVPPATCTTPGGVVAGSATNQSRHTQTWTGRAGAAKLGRPDGRRPTTLSGLAWPSYPPAPAHPIPRGAGVAHQRRLLSTR